MTLKWQPKYLICKGIINDYIISVKDLSAPHSMHTINTIHNFDEYKLCQVINIYLT